MIGIRTSLILTTLALLTACATPAQRCRSDATRDLATVRGLIAESRQTLDRGYATETRIERRTGVTFCYGAREDAVGLSFCTGDRLRERTRPVAVNLDEERAKLRSLEAKERELEARARMALGACPA